MQSFTAESTPSAGPTRHEGSPFWTAVNQSVFQRGVDVEPNNDDLLGGKLVSLGLLGPNTHQSYIIEFCNPGTVSFDVGFDHIALLLTTADALISLIPIVELSAFTPAAVATFTDRLDDISLFTSATTHIEDALKAAFNGKKGNARREAIRAADDLRKLVFDDEQFDQLVNAYEELEITVGRKALFKEITGLPLRIVELAADLICGGDRLWRRRSRCPADLRRWPLGDYRTLAFGRTTSVSRHW